MKHRIQEPDDQRSETNFIDYLYILVRSRKLIIINFFTVCILVAIYSLIMPKTFSARASIMAPSGSSGLLSSLTANLPVADLLSGLGGFSDEINSLIAILKSRTIAENTINRFNLIERYGSDDIEEALKSFQENVDISIDDEGMIVVEVTTKTKYFHLEEDEIETRNLCAEMANYVVSELDRINSTLKNQQARYNRIFIEKRYNQNKDDLAQAELHLKEFAEKYGMISLPDQVAAAIQAAASIESEIAIKEVEVAALKNILRADHPDIQRKTIELRELRKKLNEMKTAKISSNTLATFPSFSDAPALGMEYVRLKREFEVQNLIYEFLTQQYEQAKIQEAKDTPTIQVLDKGVPPILRDSPKRSLLVILAGIISIIISCAIIFTIEYMNKLRTVDKEKYDKLKFVFRGIYIFKKIATDQHSKTG